MVSKEGSLEQVRHWLEFQNWIKEIEPRHCTTWMDITGISGKGGSDGDCSLEGCAFMKRVT